MGFSLIIMLHWSNIGLKLQITNFYKMIFFLMVMSHVRFKTISVHVGPPDQTVDDQISKFNSVGERRGLTYNKSFLLTRCHSLQDKLSHNKILLYTLLETSLNTCKFLYKLLKEKNLIFLTYKIKEIAL